MKPSVKKSKGAKKGKAAAPPTGQQPQPTAQPANPAATPENPSPAAAAQQTPPDGQSAR